MDSHHGADHIAVDVPISGPDLPGYIFLGAVYSTVHAQGQAVAGAVDIRHHLFKITGAVPDNMQDRAKHLGIESLDGIYFKSTSLISASGLGSLAGNMWLVSLRDTRRKGVILIGAIVLFGCMLFLFSLSPIYILSFILLFIAGIGFMSFIAMGTTILQLSTPAEMRGRMMSQWLIGAATQYIGAFPISLVADYYGWQVAMGGSALIMLAVVFWLGIYRPTFRELRL